MLKKFVFVLFCYTFFCHYAAYAKPLDSLRLELRGAKKFIVHRVVKGDGIQTMAARYGVSEAEILSNNPLIIEEVFPGQIVKIPINESKYGNVNVPPVKSLAPSNLPLAKTVTPSTTYAEKPAPKSEAAEDRVVLDMPASKADANSTEYKIYVVASPQTVYQLADIFAVEPADIIALNSLKSNNLKEGQKVKVPYPAAPPVVAKEEPQKPKPIIVEPKPPVPAVEIAKAPAPRIDVVRDIPKREEPKKNIEPEPEKLIAKLPEPLPKSTPKIEPKLGLLPKAPIEMKAASIPVEKPAKIVEPEAKPIVKKGVQKSALPMFNEDSLKLASLKKQRNMAQLMKMDSEYVHPKGIAYRVFDYKETDYNYDLFSTLTAEENAIVVPNTHQTAGAGDAFKTHVVKKDETLQQIAQKYKVSATDIINWNGLLTYRVRAGQELTINSTRADVSPYVRTLPKNKLPQPKPGEDIIGYEKVSGLAKYNGKQDYTLGVYTNATDKGKFVYIVNRDNFKEHFARVLGPLPKGTPKEVVIILDPQSAEQLGISNSMMRVFVYFGLVNPPQAEAKN